MDDGDDRKVADEIAKKQAMLTEKEQETFQKFTDLAMAENGHVTDRYRLDVVNALIQPVVEREQHIRIHGALRVERQRAYDREQRIVLAHAKEQRIARAQSAAVKQAIPDPAQPVRDDTNRESARDDPMRGAKPRNVARDYGELQRTHDQVEKSGTAVLSKEQLQDMAARYAEVRKAGGMERSPADDNERNKLTQDQAKIGKAVDRACGPSPDVRQQQQTALLDHQHLAEQVGIEARSIGQRLRQQGGAGAEAFEREARGAHHTARHVHGQRQNLGAGMDRSQANARAVQQQEQQKQTDGQEAARGGKSLTSEQMANASGAVKEAVEQKDRTAGTRDAAGSIGVQGGQLGNTKPGNARSGDGRSRR